jgi:hypothetical protein
MQKMADKQFRDDPKLSAAGRFAAFAKTETGRTMLKASMVAKQATIDELEDEDQEPDPQSNADSQAAYRRLMQIASDSRLQGEKLTSAFARIYQDPRYRALVDADKCANVTQVSKSMGLL